MTNEQSYIDLYTEASDIIKQHGASLLNKARDEAFERFQQLGFPTSELEDYRYCKLAQELSVNYGMNLKRLQFLLNPRDLFMCDVPGIKSALFFIINDQLSVDKHLVQQESLPEGVIMCSLVEACQKHADLVAQYLGHQIKECSDGFVAFNETFAQDGYFLYVPKDIILESPIQLINILRADVDLLTVSRNLIVLEPGAQVKILVCDHAMDSINFFTDRLTEIFVGENAVFDYYSLENTHSKTNNIAQIFVNQEANSKSIFNTIGLNSGRTRNHVEIDLNGQGAETWLGGMLVSDEQQQSENFTVIRHNVPQCTTTELYKYILDGEAEGAFSGRIIVKPGAQKTIANQTNRNICLTKTAKMYSKPQLEIYADDVKCGHGATTGQLDENALFYMRTRGLSGQEARMLLLSAFTSDVLNQISVEPLRDRLRLMVEKRLRHDETKCNGCLIC